MTEAILDASVAAKFFLDEKDSALARSLGMGFDLVAPELILAELCTLFWKRVRRGDLRPRDARAALGALPLVVDLVSMQQIARSAMVLSGALELPVHDCFYLALAQQRDLPLLTADRRMVALIDAAGFDGRVMLLDRLRT